MQHEDLRAFLDAIDAANAHAKRHGLPALPDMDK